MTPMRSVKPKYAIGQRVWYSVNFQRQEGVISRIVVRPGGVHYQIKSDLVPQNHVLPVDESRAYRIKNDYLVLEAVCAELDNQYAESCSPKVGFKVGHYDPDRQEIQFYSVEAARIDALREELDKAAIDDEGGLLKKYEIYFSPIGTPYPPPMNDTMCLVMVRPRLLN
jgi:hypothetical protein